jgi:hypothetical protein
MPRSSPKLTDLASGGWSARKHIPVDCQHDYKKLYGVRWDERWQCEPMSLLQARALHREWLREVEARIANIRAIRLGGGRILTPRRAKRRRRIAK